MLFRVINTKIKWEDFKKCNQQRDKIIKAFTIKYALF